MKTSIQATILFVNRANVRPVIRQELKQAGVVDLYNIDTLEDCIDHLMRYPDALLVIDWDHGQETVNIVLRAAQGVFKVDTRPIFLLTGEVSINTVAVGTEYNVTRIHSGEVSRGALQEHFEHIVTEESKTSDYRASLTRIADARARGDWRMAGILLVDLHKHYPDNHRITCELADNLIHEDKWNEAWTVLEHLSLSDPDNLRLKHLKARCLMKRGEFDEALIILQETKLINPFHVERLIDLGHALMHAGQLKEALQNFDEALALDGESNEAGQGRAQCQLMMGDVNEALVWLKQMSGPRELASVFNNAAILSIRQGRFEHGVSLYNTAISTVGEQEAVLSRLFYNLGLAYHKFAYESEALTCFEKAISLDHLFDKPRHNASILAAKLGKSTATQLANKVSGELKEAEDFSDEHIGKGEAA